MTTLIRDATVVTVDPRRQVFNPGALVIEGDRIADVGPSAEVLGREPTADTVIDARGKLVLPGFVSAHNHLGYAVFRGRAEDIGHSPTHRLYIPMSTVLTREERRDIGSLAIAELLRGGNTTVLEMEEDADVLAPFIERVGMRALMGVMVHDVDLERLRDGETVFDAGVRERQLEQAIGFAESCHGQADGRISAVMTANGLSTSSPELLRALRDAADRLGVRLSIHIGSGDAHLVGEVHGTGSFEFAQDNGFLAGDVVAVHCYRATESDVEIMAASGVHLAHCPYMNQFRGGIAPVQALRSRGVNVGLGIDNYFSDFFDVVRSCIAVARIRANDPEIMPAEEALELATINSARALGLEREIGTLEIGKKADMQIVDMRRYGLTPINDPVRTLVYHAHAKDIDTVFVDGRVVVEDGRVLGEDETELLDVAGRASDAAWTRFVERYGGYVA